MPSLADGMLRSGLLQRLQGGHESGAARALLCISLGRLLLNEVACKTPVLGTEVRQLLYAVIIQGHQAFVCHHTVPQWRLALHSPQRGVREP